MYNDTKTSPSEIRIHYLRIHLYAANDTCILYMIWNTWPENPTNKYGVRNKSIILSLLLLLPNDGIMATFKPTYLQL
jgi:hypothetical protein